MANNIFKPYKILSTQLESLPIQAGQLIVTTDTHFIYIDISDTERIQIEANLDSLIPITTSEIDEIWNSVE